MTDDAVTIGVDFGTLSGRAVVVRVGDGAELGHRRARVPPRRDRPARCPATGRAAAAGLGAAGSRRTTSTCCARRCPAALADAGRRPGAGRRHRHRLHRLHRCCRRSPTARRCASCPSSRDRPHAYVKLWKHHAAQPQADRINALAARARRAVAGPLRREDLLRVGVRQGAAAARGGPGGLPTGWSAGSRRPTGSSGSCAASTSATPAPPATRASYQDGALPDRGTSWPRSTPTSPASSTTSSTSPIGQLGDRAGGLTAEAAGLDRAARGHRRRRRQRRRARHRAGGAGGRRRARWSRSWAPRPATSMNGDALAEVPGMCGVVDGGIVAGPVGLRGRAERRRRHLRLVRRQRACPPRTTTRPRGAGVSVHELPHRAGRGAAGRRARPGRAGLAQRQPLGAGRPRAVRPDRRPDPGHPARGHLPGAAGGDRVRHPHDHRGVRRRRRAGRPSSSSPAAC